MFLLTFASCLVDLSQSFSFVGLKLGSHLTEFVLLIRAAVRRGIAARLCWGWTARWGWTRAICRAWAIWGARTRVRAWGRRGRIGATRGLARARTLRRAWWGTLGGAWARWRWWAAAWTRTGAWAWTAWFRATFPFDLSKCISLKRWA